MIINNSFKKEIINKKINFKHFYYILISVSFVSLSLELLELIFSKDIILSWPAKSILPPLLNLKQLLIHDFYASNILDTPLKNLAFIYYKILPKDHFKLLSYFANLSVILRSLLLVSLAYVIACYSLIFYSIKKKVVDLRLNYHQFIYLFLIINFLFKFISEISKYFNKFGFLIKNTLFSFPLAAWPYPLNFTSPRGISLLLSFIALSIFLTIELFKLNLKPISINILNILSFIIFSFAVYIHPVSPFYALILVFIIIFLCPKKDLFLNWRIIFFVFTLITILGFFNILIMYPQESISNTLLFDIYVADRHPHHYLPSYYLNSIKKLIFYIFPNFIFVLFIVNRFLIRYKSLLNKLVVVSFSLLFFINFIQYILVEVYKSSLFIKLGLTSLLPLYNYYYFVVVVILSIITMEELLKNEFFISIFAKILKYLRLISLRNFLIFIFIVSMALVNVSFKFNLNKLQNSYTHEFSEFIKSLNINEKSEFLFDTNSTKIIEHPREIGLLNIYSDKYFPFNSNAIKKWDLRKKDFNNLKECITKTKNDKCNFFDNSTNDVYFVSTMEMSKLNEYIASYNINSKYFFIYKIN